MTSETHYNTPMPDITSDMRELIALFASHKVRFALCGGFAVAYYGFIRATMDIDLLVYPSLENARRIMQALHDFGFGNAGIDASAFSRPGTAITLGEQPNQIDLLTSMSTEDADSVFRNIEFATLWSMQVPVVGKHALLRAKKESSRPRDRIDYEELA